MKPAGVQDRFELTTPGYRLRARGVATLIQPDRWRGEDVAAAGRAALAEAQRSGHPHPIIVGAIPFDPSQPALLRIPAEYAWGPGTDEAPAQDSQPDAKLWVEQADAPGYRAAVAEAVREIRSGKNRDEGLRKAVLARRVLARADQAIDAHRLAERLAARNPSACTYRMDLPAGPGESSRAGALLGASPELVLRSKQGMLESHPLAGSAPRGRDAAEDETIGRTLLASAKDLEEHRHVVIAVAEVFRRFAEEVDAPSAPGLLTTPVIHHLGTRITGSLRADASPFELLYAMHPTPAVLGSPAGRAARLISRLEDFDRGLYAGLIGWQNAAGDGEWYLTLRCGVVRGRTATLYAGAGVVAGSDPAAEHRETAVKLLTFASALGALSDAPFDSAPAVRAGV